MNSQHASILGLIDYLLHLCFHSILENHSPSGVGQNGQERESWRIWSSSRILATSKYLWIHNEMNKSVSTAIVKCLAAWRISIHVREKPHCCGLRESICIQILNAPILSICKSNDFYFKWWLYPKYCTYPKLPIIIILPYSFRYMTPMKTGYQLQMLGVKCWL